MSTMLLGTHVKSIEALQEMGYDILSRENTLHNNIRTLLEQQEVSQSELAIYTGIGRQNISDILQGKLKPGVDFALKIAHVLGTSVEEIFALDESAWFRIVKEDGQTLFLDYSTMTIVSNRMRLETLKTESDYALVDSHEVITEEVFQSKLAEFVADYQSTNQQPITNRELKRRFEEVVATKRFKKIVSRMVPYRAKIDGIPI